MFISFGMTESILVTLKIEYSLSLRWVGSWGGGGQGIGTYEAPQTLLLFMSRLTKTLSTILYGRTSISRTPMARLPWLMVFEFL